MGKEIKRIAVVRLSALGDVAMTVPALYSLARSCPGCRILMVTRKPFVRMMIGCPDNVEFLEVDTRGEHSGFRGMLRLVRGIAAWRPDAVADFHNVLRSWVVDAAMRISGRRVAVVRKERSARRGLTRRGGTRRAQRAFTERYFDTLGRLGLPTRKSFVSLFDGVSLPRVPDWIGEKGAETWIGIAPFARYATKIYPPEMMERAVAMLSADSRVFLFGGGPEETRVLNEWAGKYDGVTALPGRLDMGGEIALMARLDAMVSMDSANMHLASLAGTAVVSVWGGTTPACGFMGWRQSEADAVCADLECQPCSIAGTPGCPRGTMECLRSIAPECIVEAVRRVVARRTAG